MSFQSGRAGWQNAAVTYGGDARQEALRLVRGVLRGAPPKTLDPTRQHDLLRMCDEIDEAERRRRAAYDRFERAEYLAATEQVRERVYALASALGTILPDQRALAMRLVESDGRREAG